MQFAPFAQWIALARLLDLEHLCAEFSEQLRCKPCRDQRAEFR
jgi:hypothetical protein